MENKQQKIAINYNKYVRKVENRVKRSFHLIQTGQTEADQR